MVILIEATIKYKGYDPDSLTHGSNKRICVSCDQCGRVRWLPYKNYIRYNHNGIDLCHPCTLIGKRNPNYGNHKLAGENHPNWKGGKITLICKWCGNEYKKDPSIKNSKFCSNKCRGEWLSINHCGSNNYMWDKHHSDKSKLKSSNSLIKHHYIYDHSDLSKYTTLVTRKQHGNIHKCLRRLGIKIPHINEVE